MPDAGARVALSGGGGGRITMRKPHSLTTLTQRTQYEICYITVGTFAHTGNTHKQKPHTTTDARAHKKHTVAP